MKAKKKKVTRQKAAGPTFVELGEVAVDSGQLMLCDPAYIQQLNGVEFYKQLLEGGEHVDEDNGGILNGAKITNTWGKRHLGVRLPNFGGDSVFPVRGVYSKEDGLVGIVINFCENRWERYHGERITQEEHDAMVLREKGEGVQVVRTGVGVVPSPINVADRALTTQPTAAATAGA